MQIQPGRVPRSGGGGVQAPGQHIHLSLVSPRVIHCQWESLSLGGLSLCDSRTGDRTGWLGRRAGHGLRGQAAWATPAPPLRGGPGLGLSCYSCEMEVVPPPLQDRGEDEEQMEISPHGSWRVTSGAEREGRSCRGGRASPDLHDARVPPQRVGQPRGALGCELVLDEPGGRTHLVYHVHDAGLGPPASLGSREGTAGQEPDGVRGREESPGLLIWLIV